MIIYRHLKQISHTTRLAYPALFLTQWYFDTLPSQDVSNERDLWCGTCFAVPVHTFLFYAQAIFYIIHVFILSQVIQPDAV